MLAPTAQFTSHDLILAQVSGLSMPIDLGT